MSRVKRVMSGPNGWVNRSGMCVNGVGRHQTRNRRNRNFGNWNYIFVGGDRLNDGLKTVFSIGRVGDRANAAVGVYEGILSFDDIAVPRFRMSLLISSERVAHAVFVIKVRMGGIGVHRRFVHNGRSTGDCGRCDRRMSDGIDWQCGCGYRGNCNWPNGGSSRSHWRSGNGCSRYKSRWRVIAVMSDQHLRVRLGL